VRHERRVEPTSAWAQHEKLSDTHAVFFRSGDLGEVGPQLSEQDVTALIVNGFFEPFVKELPMEYAVELNRLLALSMEGAIG